MNRRTVLTKTGKGLMEATGKSSNLSRDLRNILKEIDGKVRVSDLLKKFERMSEPELISALRNLEQGGYVREFIGQQDGGPQAPIGHAPASPPSADATEDLDFTDFTPAKPSAKTSEDARLQAQVIRMREEAAAKAKAEAERRAGPASQGTARTQAETLDQARREAEERQRREAEEKARREAEARARIDAEQAAKRDAEGRVRSEAEEKTRRGGEGAASREPQAHVSRETEERARREEVEGRMRIEAETRAKVEAEKRARREFEERARRAEEERSRREVEQRRLAEEARKRRDAEESEALIRSLREQEEKVQQEAEQAEREEKQRREREERAGRESEEEARRKEEKKRDEEKERRTREEERKQADSDAEEAAQVRQATRAKEQAARGKQEAARASGPAQFARKAWAKGKSRSLVRQLAVMLLVLLVVSIAAIPFVPLESGPYEKAAQEWLGEPVKIGTFNLTLLPLPRLKFEKVVIGKEPQMRVATIRATPQIGSVLAEKKAFKRLELENATFPREYLAALLGTGKGEAFAVERLTAKGLKLDIPGLNLPALELDASFSPDGALKSVTLANAERNLLVKLEPQGGKAAIEISSDKFPFPIGADLALSEFAAKGTVTRSEITLGEAEARAFGGRLFGSARLRWSDGWSLEGEIAGRLIDAARIAAPLVAGGTLEGKGVYSMRALLPERLLMNARLEGNFTVQKGSITNVDMTRLLQGSGSGGGTTLFSEMSGGIAVDPNRVLVRQIRLVAGLLNGAGQVEMDPQNNLSGRLQIELRAQTVQARATLAVSGTLKNPQFRRSN
jgi:hypothetical protein